MERLPNIWGNAQIFPIYEEAISHIWLCNCSTLNFLIYEENLISFIISVHTEKTQYRKSDTNIPRKGIARPQSQFPHSCFYMSDLYISKLGLPIGCRKYMDRLLGIYKSLTDTWMWKLLGLRPRKSFSRIIHKWDFRCSEVYRYSSSRKEIE